MMVASVAPFNSLGQDNKNGVQHDFFGHVTPLASVSVSDDANGTCVIIT